MSKAHTKNVEGRWGKVHFLEQDKYIGKSLQHYGEYNPDETELLLSLAAKAGKDKLTLDIGANFGVMAQALAHNGYRVEAFEPQPVIFEILQKNFKGKCHNTAVGRTYGKTCMPIVLYSDQLNFGAMECGTQSVLGSFEVPVIPIDSLGYTDIGLMKIDVEGYEEEVLRGARETITKCSPILYVEDDRPEKRASLHKTLEELGYRWEQHTPHLFRSNNFFGKKENIWSKNYYSQNIICYK